MVKPWPTIVFLALAAPALAQQPPGDYYEQGLACQEIRAWEAAVDSFMAVVENWPDDDLAPRAYMEVARCYFLQGAPKLGFAYLDDLFTRFPKASCTAEALELLGYYAFIEGDELLFHEAARDCVGFFPNSDAAFRCRLLSGKLEASWGNDRAALDALESLLADVIGQHGDPWCNLASEICIAAARIMSSSGMDRDALEIYSDIWTNSPGSDWEDDSLYEGALCFFRLGRSDSARQALAKIALEHRESIYFTRTKRLLGE